MIRFLTAGESHGPGLTAIIDGLPAGIPFSSVFLNKQMDRRRKGYGRGGRMSIESDAAEITSGIRHGYTLGGPVTVFIKNKDNGNWGEIMSPDEISGPVEREVLKPRPGHGDLSGILKYGFTDCRNVLERASARETAARVAAGSLCKALLSELGIHVNSYVVSIGNASLSTEEEAFGDDNIPKDTALLQKIEASSVSCFDSAVEEKMIKEIDKAKADGDSLGGIIKIIITGVPTGFGSHTQWDRRLDSGLAAGIMSIQAVKGVEIGLGFRGATLPGSAVHDEIFLDDRTIHRPTNHAGGIEGGISNGEDILIRFAMKPIPTLYKPLSTFDLRTGEPTKADIERSDVCAVPAAAVVGEAMAAIVLAGFVCEKLGGDSMQEIKERFERMKETQKNHLPANEERKDSHE